MLTYVAGVVWGMGRVKSRRKWETAILARLHPQTIQATEIVTTEILTSMSTDSRTEPNLDDLNQAFQDVGVCLHELEDFVSQVDQVPFIHQLPRFPKPKPCVLHHPCNGEIAERLEQYFDYLPPLISKLLQNEGIPANLL